MRTLSLLLLVACGSSAGVAPTPASTAAAAELATPVTTRAEPPVAGAPVAAPAAAKSLPPEAPATTTQTNVRCGAPCKDAERYLGGPSWDYRKSAAIYREQCRSDHSGPAEACRLFALAGLETRGTTLKKPDVLSILHDACKRGDGPACGWKTWIASGNNAPPSELASQRAACEAGDRAACAPLFLSMAEQARKKCDVSWWALAEASCTSKMPEGCIFYSKLLDAEHTCNRAAAKMSREQSTDVLARMCEAGDPDTCLELGGNDDALWHRRCKAGEQFACEAVR